MPEEPQDDELVMSLVEQALAHPAQEREACLRKACAGNASLFAQAWNYVQWEQRMDGFLQDPLYRIPRDEPPFRPGELLEDRFRVVRVVAEGGMGIVYEARDEKLDRRIALKSAKAGFRNRLPPEVRHATEISHPNVCKTFEFHTASTSHGEIDFLTMEFLDGEMLSERLRGGSIPEEDARDIAAQICAGLAEAHRERIVHGDLKSNNIILTTNPDGSRRAVITDFGLARTTEARGSTAQSGSVLGTPDYMAPELLQGHKATIASDIYALGVILEELAAAHLSPLSAAPNQTTLSPKWQRVVSRCKAADPAKRFPSADEVAEALAPARYGRLILTLAAAAIFALVTGVASYQRAAQPGESWRLALLPLASSPDLAAVAANLSRDTADQLAKLKGGNVARLSFIPLNTVQRASIGTPEAARAVLKATHVLQASLTTNGSNLMLRATLTATGLHEWSAEYASGEERFMPLALAGFVSSALGLPPLVAAPTVNAAAQADYRAAIAEARQNSAVDLALEYNGRALSADSESPLTHAGLAEAEWLKYKLTGDASWLAQSNEQARQARIRNPDLAAVHDISGLLKAEAAEAGWFAQAQEEYLRAAKLDPSDSEAWRRLGQAYETNNQLDDALVAFKRAVSIAPGDLWAHQSLAAFYYHRADYTDAIPEFRRMVELAPRNPTAHYALAIAYGELAQFADDERELLISIGLEDSAQAQHSLGYVYTLEGLYDDAIVHYQRAMRLPGPKTALLWLNLGAAYSLAGMKGNAHAAFSAGLPLAEEQLNNNPASGRFRAERAYLNAALGMPGAESEAKAAARFSPNDKDTLWMSAATFEVLGKTDLTIELLNNAPEGMRPSLLSELLHYPGVPGLHKDRRFIELAALYHVH